MLLSIPNTNTSRDMNTNGSAQTRFTTTISLLLLILVIFLLPVLVLCSSSASHDQCRRFNQPNLLLRRSDQISVLINGFSESRIPLLQSIAAAYSASPFVSSVFVLWGNPSTSPHTLANLARNLTLSSFGSAAISVIRHPTTSLNARFLPRSLPTRAVLICDDDVEVDSKSFEFAFRIWRSNPDRLIGLFVRSHDFDLSTRKWIYTVHPHKYSIVLTKFMILKTEYMFQYSCKGGAIMSEMRGIVDRMQNCEDILMNFVVADETNAGPIFVGAEMVRDWGDSRNDGDGDTDEQWKLNNDEMRDVGLSSRRGEHRKRRGECIRELHKVLGRMPLRYSYGKVVNSVDEQGLCRKGGKLVFCDQYQ